VLPYPTINIHCNTLRITTMLPSQCLIAIRFESADHLCLRYLNRSVALYVTVITYRTGRFLLLRHMPRLIRACGQGFLYTPPLYTPPIHTPHIHTPPIYTTPSHAYLMPSPCLAMPSRQGVSIISITYTHSMMYCSCYCTWCGVIRS
jgi:hypothetical protein